MREYRTKYVSLVSGVRALPNEVLSTIFVFCFDPQPSPTSGKSALLIRLPFSVTATCSRWREVALSTPHLWSTFTASLGANWTIAEVDALASWATTFAERSGAVPMHVDLELCDEVGDAVYQGIQHTTTHMAAAAALCATAHRWISAHIVFSPRSYIYHALAHLLCALPGPESFVSRSESEFDFGSESTAFACLESLVLESAESFNDEVEALPLPPTPRLHSAKLTAIDPAKITPGLPWAQLRELSLSMVDWSAVCNTLKDCLVLVHLDIIYVYPSSSSLATQPTLTHRCLESLCLIATTPDQLPPLDGLTLPALRSFSLSCTARNPDTPQAEWNHPWQDFFARSKCTIKSLILAGISLPPPHSPGWSEWSPLFLHLRTLVIEEIEDVPMRDALLMLNSHKATAPHLETLDYTSCGDSESVKEIFDLAADMIEMRWAGGTKSNGKGRMLSLTMRGLLSSIHNIPSLAYVRRFRRRGFTFDVLFLSP